MAEPVTSKELTALYEIAKANAAKVKPPQISLRDTIQRCYLLSSPPGTPPLKEATLDMIANGASMWVEMQIKHENLPRELKEIQSMIRLLDMKDKLEYNINILVAENKKLRKLVRPKPDAP